MMMSPQSLGLGNCPPPSANGTPQIAGASAGAAISAGAGIAVATGVLSAASAGILAPIAPIVGLIVQDLFTPDYCKIDASNEANTISAEMQQNLTSWQNLPASQKCTSVQAYYLNNYDELWQALVNFCSNSQLGSAGQNCISDRSPSGKYPWQAYYRDPISSDPNVLPDLQCPALIAQGVSNATGGLLTSGDIEGLAIPAALILLALFL